MAAIYQNTTCTFQHSRCWIGAAISAATALGTGIAQAKQAKKQRQHAEQKAQEANKASRDFQREMYNTQRADAKDWYDKFQSPLALRNQYSQAGFSPYASIGQSGADMSSIAMPSDSGSADVEASAANVGNEAMQNAIGTIGGSLERSLTLAASLAQAKSSIEKTDAERDKVDAEADAIRKRNNVDFKTRDTEFGAMSNYEYNQMLVQISNRKDINLKDMDMLLKGTEYNINQQQRLKLVEETNRLKQEISNLVKTNSFIDAQTKGQLIQNRINEYKAKLADNGINPDASLIEKLLNAITGHSTVELTPSTVSNDVRSTYNGSLLDRFMRFIGRNLSSNFGTHRGKNDPWVQGDQDEINRRLGQGKYYH